MELLDPVEVRVLGALIEKEATTPEYYPLSMNALVNACNQKSNREPVVSYEEVDVADAMLRLRDKKLAVMVTGSGRVNKYAQRISETLNLGRREMAILGVLLLRGLQTLGEIKDRSERAYAFTDLAEAERVLDKLSEWPGGPLATKLARQAGQKEARYGHLLSGEPVLGESGIGGYDDAPGRYPRLLELEQELSKMRTELDELKRQFEEFQAAFR